MVRLHHERIKIIRKREREVEGKKKQVAESSFLHLRRQRCIKIHVAEAEKSPREKSYPLFLRRLCVSIVVSRSIKKEFSFLFLFLTFDERTRKNNVEWRPTTLDVNCKTRSSHEINSQEIIKYKGAP